MHTKSQIFRYGLAIFIAVIFAALLGYAVYLNKPADLAAKRLCKNISIGSSADLAVEQAARDQVKHTVTSSKEEIRIIYQGSIFHSGVCIVRVSKGRVISTRTKPDGE